MIRALKAVPRDVVREKSVEELAEHIRGLMLKAMEEYNDYATPEMLAVKKFTWTMWGVFVAHYVQQYFECLLFLWVWR